MPGRMRWKARTRSFFSCNNLHQVSSGLKGLSSLLRRWHRWVCHYRIPVQSAHNQCNGKLLKGFLSLSQSSSISTALNRQKTSIILNIKTGTYPANTLNITRSPNSHNWWPKERRKEKKKKKKGWFPKQQQLAHCIILFLYAKLDTCETKQLIAVCHREKHDFPEPANFMELKLHQHSMQRWRKIKWPLRANWDAVSSYILIFKVLWSQSISVLFISRSAFVDKAHHKKIYKSWLEA